MGDPRNPKRKYETWDQVRLDAMQAELVGLIDLAPNIVLSGGWAWHFLSPLHTEYKLLHDHKDVDLFVKPEEYSVLVGVLQFLGYERIWTRFDAQSKGEFYRWQKMSGDVKVILDVFLRDVDRFSFMWSTAKQPLTITVVDPKQLLTFYGEIHSTDDCVAVVAANKLVREDKVVYANPALIAMP